MITHKYEVAQAVSNKVIGTVWYNTETKKVEYEGLDFDDLACRPSIHAGVDFILKSVPKYFGNGYFIVRKVKDE